MHPSIVLVVPTTTSPVRVTRLRKLPANVDQATMTLAGSSAALPVSARYSDFVRAPMGPIERSAGHGAWKLEVSASLDVGESWNLGVFLAHALKAHSRLQEKQNDASDQAVQTVWATGAVDVIDLRILPVGHVETKARQALAADTAPDLLLLPLENLGDIPEDVRAELEAKGTRIVAPATMAEALTELGLPSDWAKDAAPELAGWRGSPYRGLEAYEAEHRSIFFGRGHARAEALERLRTRAERDTALLVIHGKSGVGKSSLAMAGLLDDVVEKVPGRAPFCTAIIRFGGSSAPLVSLRDGFAHALGLEDSGLLSMGSAAEWMEAWPANDDPRTMLLILDQLEQGLLADEADVAAFGEALATLVKTGRVWVIATLRSDRIDLLERAPALATMADGDGLYRLVRPTLAELGEIIRAPSKLAGITFEEGEGERLLDLLAQEAMSAPDSLPLLQVTLMRLAEQRDADGRVNMRDYERIGGFSGAVERLANETVRDIEDAGIDPNVVDRALATLVRIDPETDRVDAKVIDPDMQPDDVGRVLDALVEARLATASTLSETYDLAANGQGAEANGLSDSGRRVRLAHETLIREWLRLHDLAARLRSELALRDRLEEEALRWEQDGRPTGDLISNTVRLAAAEDLIEGGLAAPSTQAREYIEASQKEVERQEKEKQVAEIKDRQGRIRRRIAIAAALVAFVMVGMTGLLVNQAQQTRAAQELAEAQLEATRQAEELTVVATTAQKLAEEQLVQAQINRAMYLMETARSAYEEDPDLANELLVEIVTTPEQLESQNLYNEFLAIASHARVEDREIMRLVASKKISGISLSSDGTLLVTALRGGTAEIWDMTTGQTLFTLHGHVDDVSSAAFSPDGTRVVTGSQDKTARVWDVETGETLVTLQGHLQEVDTVAFSSDGTRIVTGGVDYTARVWDASTGEMILILRGHNVVVNSAAFSPDGTKVVTGASDGNIRIWDVGTGETLTILFANENSIRSVAFSPDGTRVVTGARDDTARIWDVATGEMLITLRGHQGAVHSAAFSPNGKRVVTGADDQTVRVWDVKTGETLVRLQGHEERVTSAAFLPDGTRVVTGSWDRTARIWDVTTGLKTITLPGQERPVSSVAFSPDGTRVVTGSWDRTARIWDVATGEITLTLRGHEDYVSSVAFSPDGTHVLSGSWDKTAQIWDVSTEQTLFTLRGHKDGVTTAAFSPAGTRAVTGSWDNTARIWDATTGETTIILRGHEHSVISAAFSPDGTRIITGSGDRTAKVWDVTTGEAVLTLRGHEGVVNSATFSPDGTHVVTSSQDQTARIWDIETGETLSILRGHEQDVEMAAFSPNGTQIVTTSEDETARIWDVATGNVLFIMRGHRDVVNSASFSDDGTLVVTGASDGTVQVWGVKLPRNDQIFALLHLSNFERLKEEDRFRFGLQPAQQFLPSVSEILLAVQQEFVTAERSTNTTATQEPHTLWTYWQDAAAKGVPEAHETLSTAFLTGQGGLEQNLETALFHAAISTWIYEALDYEEAAAPMRIRRANLARTLPAETVADLWPQIRDWRPRVRD